MRKARQDFVPDHIRLAERIRQLEIRSDSRVIMPQAPLPNNDELDVLAQMIAVVGAWDTRAAENEQTGHPIGWTARALLEELWGSGWFGNLRSYVETFADIDHFDYINPDTGNPYTPSEWKTLIDSTDDEVDTPWGKLGDGFTNFFSGPIASDWWGLLMDVYAMPTQAYITPLRPSPFVGSTYGDPALPGDLFVDSWLVGGSIGSAPSVDGALVRERMLYFTGLPPAVGDLYSWNYTLATNNGARPFTAPSGCPTPDLLIESSLLRPRAAQLYDSTFPRRANPAASARPPGGYIAYGGPSSGDYKFYIGYDGQYVVMENTYACADAGEVVDGGLKHWSFNIPGIPLGPYLGLEICPDNPAGDTTGCTGVQVMSAELFPSEVRPVMMPIPYQLDPTASTRVGPAFSDNFYMGFGSFPDITWPGIAQLKADIAAVIGRYPAVLSWLSQRLAIKGYDGTLPQYERMPFPQDGTWQQVPIYAPWRGRVECRVVGRHVHFRGFVLTHGNPTVRPLFAIPAGLPKPGATPGNAAQPTFLAGSGRTPGPPVGKRFAGGSDLLTPREQHKDVVPLRVGRTPGNKWYFQTYPSGTKYGLGNKSSGVSSGLRGSGYHAVMVDGLSYVGQEDGAGLTS
jgi:hypothetical protein